MKDRQGGDVSRRREFSLPLPAKEAPLAPWVPGRLCACELPAPGQRVLLKPCHCPRLCDPRAISGGLASVL